VEAALLAMINERRNFVAGKAAALTAGSSCASGDGSGTARAVDAALDGCILDELLRATTFSSAAPSDYSDLISADELLHNLHNMMIASFETTSHAICATLCVQRARRPLHFCDIKRRYFLAKAPEWQLALLADDNKTAMRFVLNESLRLLPPVLQMQRCCRVACEAGALHCPFNTSLVVDILAMQRSQQHWGVDAEVFDPSRWQKIYAERSDGDAAGGGSLGPSLADMWMPFGAGSKSCIGQSLALQTVGTIISRFLRVFHVTFGEGHDLQFAQTPTLRITNGLLLQLRRR
jgi:cytochrome P450